MARILRDYKCQEHGFFEGFEPICPEGCTDELVLQVFLKSPGFVSAKSKAADKNLQSLATEFGMSDIKSTRIGENQAGYLKRNNKFSEKEYAEAEKYATPKKRGRPRKDTQNQPQPQADAPREARAGDAAVWGGGFQGMNMQSVLAGQFARPVGPSLGKAAEITSLTPRAAGINNGPVVHPQGTIRDPDNLQIKK
jgi:hypothetical protein